MALELTKIVLNTISRYRIIKQSDNLLLAVSGGSDSMAMFHLFIELHKQLKCSLSFIHIDHGLRGEQSKEDAKFVARIAAEMGIAGEVIYADPEVWKSLGSSVQTAARQMRYKVFEDVAKRLKCNKIATAHTSSDQAETVLGRILSGTGVDGLAGIPPVRDRMIIRPLIEASREQVLEFLKDRGLSWREDPSNQSDAYERNRIRHDLLPCLREKYNPQIDSALIRLADSARENAEALAIVVNQWFSENADCQSESLLLPLHTLRNLPQGMRHGIYRQAYLQLTGAEFAMDRAACLRIDDLVTSNSPQAGCNLPGGAGVLREPESIRFVPGELPTLPAIQLAKLGIIKLEGYEMELSINEVSGLPDQSWSIDEIYLPKQMLTGLAVRTWRDGDRIFPEGMEGHKKLQDLFTDAKVPAFKRRRLPILVHDDQVVWVIGLRRDRRSLPTPEDAKLIHISVKIRT